MQTFPAKPFAAALLAAGLYFGAAVPVAAAVVNEQMTALPSQPVAASVAKPDHLAQARTSLWRAMKDQAKGAYAAARSDLVQAIGELGAVTKSANTATSEAAGDLLRTATTLKDKVDQSGGSTGRELKGLWRRAEALSEWTDDYAGTVLQRLEVENPAKSELIGAKLHVAYARIDKVTLKDTFSSEVQLGEARVFLDNAIAAAGADLRPGIRTIRAQVDELEGAIRKPAGASAPLVSRRFDQAVSELRRLVDRA